MNYAGVGAVKTKIEQYTKVTRQVPRLLRHRPQRVSTTSTAGTCATQQQINISRIAEQRMAIQFMFTQLVLRWENESNYIGTRTTATIV